MNRRYAWVGCLLVCGLVGATVAAKPHSADDPLVVHEWGTFLSMNGSDGVTLDGMYHEEHALPDFVHSRSRDQLRIPASDVKGETPVIYFYTDRARQVSVKVGFPQGVWTQWYPQAEKVGPSWEQFGSPLEPKQGHITWEARIEPAVAGRKAPELPKTASDALWNYAREVDAAYVRTTDPTRGQSEVERFLFYRGLGQAKMPLGLAYADGGTLTLPADAGFSLKHLFVLRVEKGKAAYRYLPELRPGDRRTQMIPAMATAQPLSDFEAKISEDLAGRLEQSGLFPKEARAMVNTWRHSYFESDGIRVLYVLPQQWTEAFLPMTLSPKPDMLVRVMVGRTELLTPEREAQATAAVRDLASAEAARREKAFEWLREQGRYVEPILRQVLRTHPEARTETLCNRLLLTDFATTLRAAARSAADGTSLVEQPYSVHSQLAVVLREMGLNAEAKQEADAVLATLRTQPEPRMDESEARHYLRAFARAMEGTGDDVAAAQGYGKFITFASQVNKGCAGCHSGITAPRDMAWFRDWYVGRRFADCITRSGHTEAEITAQKAALVANPNDTAAQMKLAYLYASQGKQTQAEAVWTALTPPGKAFGTHTAAR